MKAAIFVGGMGKRMAQLTVDKPKPLVEVAGRPIIDWQIDWLKSCGIDALVLMVGNHSEKVIEHAKAVSNWGIGVEFFEDIPGAGTGGALKGAEKSLKNEKKFYIMYGDTLTNMPLNKMRTGKYVATMALVNEPSPYGVIRAQGSKAVEFVEKPILKNIWINSGPTVATPAIFDYVPEKGDLSKITYHKLAELGLLGCKKFPDVYWRDVGTLKDVESATEDLQNGLLKFR